ncbi:uncharacterized protein [Miscanthus floridulus]|uniref:uncharacterized protein n=1 Tax=Miscanthus floridulus TaxID=154761 RepID=UPI00345B0588
MDDEGAGSAVRPWRRLSSSIRRRDASIRRREPRSVALVALGRGRRHRAQLSRPRARHRPAGRSAPPGRTPLDPHDWIRRRRGSICPPPPNGSAAKGSLRPDPCLVARKKVEGRRIRPSPTAGEPATPAPLSAPGLRASGPRQEADHAREATPPLRNAAPPADEAEPPHLRAERPPQWAPPPCQEE